jgi:hypothetical protein
MDVQMMPVRVMTIPDKTTNK